MTYEELKQNFLFSKEARMSVRKDGLSYHLVKFPVTENVQLVYVGRNYTYNRSKYAFSFDENMVVGGIIAHNDFYILH